MPYSWLTGPDLAPKPGTVVLKLSPAVSIRMPLFWAVTYLSCHPWKDSCAFREQLRPTLHTWAAWEALPMKASGYSAHFQTFRILDKGTQTDEYSVLNTKTRRWGWPGAGAGAAFYSTCMLKWSMSVCRKRMEQTRREKTPYTMLSPREEESSLLTLRFSILAPFSEGGKTS